MKTKHIWLCILALIIINGCESRQTYQLNEFSTFMKGIKEKHDYVKMGSLELWQSNTINLYLTTKKDIKWSEMENLLNNDLLPFMRGNDMKKSIQSKWGTDPLKNQYPGLYVYIYFDSSSSYAVLSSSYYYNTSDMTNLQEKNIQGYNNWGLTVNKDIVKDVPDDLQQSITFE